MQRKKDKSKLELNWHHAALIFAILIGCVLGLLYEDKPELTEQGNRIVVYQPLEKRDTILVHDTIFKVKTIVRWKKKNVCCCCRWGCTNNDKQLTDSI